MIYNNRKWVIITLDDYTDEQLENLISNAIQSGVSALRKSLDNAKAHYENSIIKLAYRIVDTGLNQNNLQFTNSYVGVNIDTIISDGEKQVKAQTICAWGAIQKPHYRYLVK